MVTSVPDLVFFGEFCNKDCIASKKFSAPDISFFNESNTWIVFYFIFNITIIIIEQYDMIIVLIVKEWL